MAQRLKRLPGMRETQVQSLGQEDPLEEEMAPHSSTLAWRIPWREEPGRLQSMGSHSRTRLKRLSSSSSRSSLLAAMYETQVQFLGQEDPLEKEMATHSQYSYLEDSMVRRPCRGCSPWSVKESDTTE